MDKKGVSTYRLREECGIDSKTVRRLKANQNAEMKTLDRICSFLDCKIEDVVEFIKD
ncbi:MAG: helix-turn-helix domain-containing protein [Christensenellales bacterium]